MAAHPARRRDGPAVRARPDRLRGSIACCAVRLGDFDYALPADRIAQVPVEPRDSARLLVDCGSAPPEHRHVRDLCELLHDGDLLVVNDTKVMPARLALQRETGGAAEVLLLDALDGARRTWEALVRPARRLREGEVLHAPTGDS